MENNMSYRDTPAFHHSTKPSSSIPPPNYQDYDADDERTLGLHASDFILPDGTGALDLGMIKRIEDARQLLHKLEVDRADREGSKSGANGHSSKERRGGISLQGGEGIDFEDIPGVMDVESEDQDSELNGMMEEDYESDSPVEPRESSGAKDSMTAKTSAEASKTADTMDPNWKNKHTEDPEARIRYLEGIIKTKDEDIEMLRTMNRKHVETIRKLVLARETKNDKPKYEDQVISKSQMIGAMLMDQKIKREENLLRRSDPKTPFYDRLRSDLDLDRKRYFENKKRKASSKEDEDEDEPMGDEKTPEHKRPKHRHRASLPSFPASDRPDLSTSPDFRIPPHTSHKTARNIYEDPPEEFYGPSQIIGRRGHPMTMPSTIGVELGRENTGADFWTSKNQVNPAAKGKEVGLPDDILLIMQHKQAQMERSKIFQKL